MLNEWLNQTGTESRKFMCVYETNRPEVLDPAVQSRITRSIEMPPPHYPEILRMLEQYLNLYVVKEHKLAPPVKPQTEAAQGQEEAAKDDKGKEKEGKGKEKEKEKEDKAAEDEEDKEGLTLVGVNDHGYHKDIQAFGLDLPAIAQRLAKEHFVGRDVSNLCIAIAQALYAEGQFMLTKELVERVVEEQIHKKRQENIYLNAREERIRNLKRYDVNQRV